MYPVVSSTTSISPPVRFGRVPKREKAKILAAMHSVNARALEQNVAFQLEDLDKLMNVVIAAHYNTWEFTDGKLPAIAHEPHDSLAMLPRDAIEPYNKKLFTADITKIIEFAKCIPGFVILTQDDKNVLLRLGVVEVLMVRLSCLYDPHNQAMICKSGKVQKREELQRNDGFISESMFIFAVRLHMFQLTDGEVALFCAILLISPDRPGLRNVDLVEKMRDKLMEALSRTISHNHPQAHNLMQELLQTIPDLRTHSALHNDKIFVTKNERQNAVNLAILDNQQQQQQQQQQLQEEDAQHDISNMQSLYQSRMGHWNNYGMAGSKGHGQGHGSEDSRGNWDEGDHMVPSPYLSHQPMIHHRHQQQQQHNAHTMDTHTHDGSHSWSPDSHSDPGKDHDLYGGSPGSSSESGSFMVDDDGSCVRSPLGSLTSPKGSGADNESMCSGESLSPSAPKQGHGGSSSGDEGCSSPPGDDQLDGEITYHDKRKLESPTDSGIESGKEFSSVPSRGTSECSSPQSLVMDEDKLSKDGNKDEEPSKSPNSPPQSRLAREMPVLKRALEAPPMNSIDPYKPHKKFRALRKESGSASPTQASPASPEAPAPASHHVTCNQSVLPITQSPRTGGPAPTLASTHMTLARSLAKAPLMSEQQLKRTDILHNIIMCNEPRQHDHSQNYSMNNGSRHMYNGTCSPSLGNGQSSKNSPGYYMPQMGAHEYSSTGVTQVTWPNFVTGAQTSSTATLSSSLASQVQQQQQQTSGSQFPQVSQLQQHLQITQAQQQTKQQTSAAMSPHLHQHHQIAQQQQQQQAGNGQSPRHYYHVQSHQSSAGSSPVPRTTHSPGQNVGSQLVICNPSQDSPQFTVSRPARHESPVIMAQSGELRRLMVSGDNQPLNLSKKVASPPPLQMPVLLARLQDCNRSVMSRQGMKMEVL